MSTIDLTVRPPGTLRSVRLLIADPELAEGIPAEDLLKAQQLVVAPAVELEPGEWDPAALCGHEGSSLLVIDGPLLRETVIADRPSTEMLGPGDIVRAPVDAAGLVPHTVRWWAVERSTVAVLGPRFAMAARHWPGLSAEVTERLHARADRLAQQLAIAQLPRIEQRLLAIFWLLAERWGRVTPDGCLVPLTLTHESLGRLVGARRPTVSLALADLAAAGHVRRRADGGWLLQQGSQDSLAPGVPRLRSVGT